MERWGRGSLLAAVCVLSALPVGAEVKVQERTQFKFEGVLGGVVNLFGGKAAREGFTSTVAVDGDRRSRMSDLGGEIVDLKEEKVYELDVKNRTYTVTTFAELRRRMQEQEEKAARSAPSGDSGPSRSKEAAPSDRQIEVDFDVKETGQRKAVNGFDAKQVILTVAMREKGKTLEQSGGLVLASDMWVTPSVKGSKEVATFEQRYMEKLHGPVAMAQARAQMAMLLGTYPQLKEGFARMQAESAKMEGTAISTTLTVQVVKTPEQQQASGSSGDGEGEAPKGLGGMLGRKLGKLGKKDESAPAGGAPADKGRSTLLTTTHDILSVTPEVTDADVAIPAGYKLKS